MSTTLHWGIIGPGRIAHKFADALAYCDHNQLVAVASRSQQNADAFASRWQLAHAYDDEAALLANPQVQAVYIATPHNYHYPAAMRALKAGKHVLIEKPACVNAAQFARLCEMAEQHDCMLMEAVWSRFLPYVAQAKQWLADKRIGEVQSIQSSIGIAFEHGPEHRINNKALAGGAMLDLGVYALSLSQFMLGQSHTAIQALGKLSADGVDESVMATVQYSGGQLAQFATSIVSQQQNALHIYGSEGTITLEPRFWSGSQVSLQRGDDIQTLTLPWAHNGFEYQIEDMARCIRAGKRQSDVVPHRDTLAVLTQMDEIRRQIGLYYGDEFEKV